MGCKIFHTFQLQSNFSFQDKSLTSWIFQHIGPGRDKIYEILNKRLYPEKIRSFYYEKFGTFGELGCFARFSLVFRALFYLALAGFFSVLFYMDLMKDISFFFLIHHMSTKILVIWVLLLFQDIYRINCPTACWCLRLIEIFISTKN